MDFDIEEKGIVVVIKSKYDLYTETIKLEAIVLLAARELSSGVCRLTERRLMISAS